MPSSKSSDVISEKKVEKLESQLEILSTLVIQAGKNSQEKNSNSSAVYENIENIIKTISSISTSLVGLSFVFYAIGFVIVNLHLLSLGARKFDLLNPAYLSAGIVFFTVNCIPIILSTWFTFLGYLRLRKNRANEAGIDKFITYSSKSDGTNILFATSFVISGLFFFLVWSYVSEFSLSTFLNLDWRHQVLQVGYLIILSMFSASISLIIEYIIETREIGIEAVLSNRILSTKFRLWTSAAFMLIIFLGFNLIITWGQALYSQINPAFGGGKPVVIELVGKDDTSQKSLETAGIKFANGVSEPVKLLDDDENAILIALNNGSAVKISKEFLSTIIYLPSKTPVPSPSITPTALPATPTPP